MAGPPFGRLLGGPIHRSIPFQSSTRLRPLRNLHRAAVTAGSEQPQRRLVPRRGDLPLLDPGKPPPDELSAPEALLPVGRGGSPGDPDPGVRPGVGGGDPEV